VTTLAVVLFLGLNVSILGLVSVPNALLYVLAEVLALIMVLGLVYAGSLAFIWRDAFALQGSGGTTSRTR
jgi:hypothetical protein